MSNCEHDFIVDESGEPIVPAFLVCVRCGKWMMKPKKIDVGAEQGARQS